MSTYHFLLLMLAIIDWLICVAETPEYLKGLEIISSTEVLYFLTTPLHLQSMFGLFFVSLLRYQSIVHPFQKKWTKKRYFILFLATLIVSYLTYLPNFLSSVKKFHIILSFFGKNVLYVDISISFVFMVILIVLYFKMSKVLKESQESRSKERNKKVLKTLRFLLCLFAVTLVFAKITILSLQESITKSHVLEMSRAKFTALQFAESLLIEAIYLNNVGNFFIYLKMMPEFQRFIRNLLCCRCRKACKID